MATTPAGLGPHEAALVGPYRTAIATRELSTEGIPSPQGRRQWDAGTLGRMLRNPAYMGRAAFGKTQSGPGPLPGPTGPRG